MRWVVAGIGNMDRADDGAGRLVARRLRILLPLDAEISEHDGEAASILSAIEGAEGAILVDACVSGEPAGTVRRIDVHQDTMPELQFGLSTHGFGLGAAMALGRALGALPERCIIYAVEAGSFDVGAPLSAEVAAGIETVALAVANEVMQDA